jgi:hypothetical protein
VTTLETHISMVAECSNSPHKLPSRKKSLSKAGKSGTSQVYHALLTCMERRRLLNIGYLRMEQQATHSQLDWTYGIWNHTSVFHLVVNQCHLRFADRECHQYSSGWLLCNKTSQHLGLDVTAEPRLSHEDGQESREFYNDIHSSISSMAFTWFNVRTGNVLLKLSLPLPEMDPSAHTSC